MIGPSWACVGDGVVRVERIGHERAIRGIARVILQQAPILCGVAILENQYHDTAKLVVLPREEIETGEPPLLEEARRLLPRLPFEEMDLLIVDRLGKNISGAGMDPNITGRNNRFIEWDMKPLVKKIVVLGLVTTKSPDIESEDVLRRRIDEASRYLPLDQLSRRPQPPAPPATGAAR